MCIQDFQILKWDTPISFNTVRLLEYVFIEGMWGRSLSPFLCKTLSTSFTRYTVNILENHKHFDLYFLSFLVKMRWASYRVLVYLLDGSLLQGQMKVDSS